VWALSASPLNKQIVLNAGATIFNESGGSQIAGPVTLTGNDLFNIGGTSLTFSNAISGAGNLIKTGTSPLNLTGTNIYTGNTVVSNGTIFLVANGSISGSATISLNSGTVLDVSGRADKTLTLNSGQILQGGGTVNGSLLVGGNATVSPGNPAIGTLTVTNVVTLQGITFMKLSKSPVVTNDVIRGAATINYGGTLSLTNLSGTLAASDSFKLFSANNYGGAFAKIFPAIPRAGLVWNTGQLNSGILKIASGATTPPQINVALSGGNLVVGGTSSLAGATYHLLASTNVALPLVNWTPVATNTFDVNGNFSVTNPVAANAQGFLVIQVQ
jgi:fibronectin-binding autotransporter adhesin